MIDLTIRLGASQHRRVGVLVATWLAPAWLTIASMWLPGSTYATEIPSPFDVLGFDPTASGAVVDSGQVNHYTEVVAALAPSVATFTIGLSTDGRPLRVTAVSAPHNLRHLSAIVSQRDKSIALVTFGIHPDEVASTASYFRLLFDLARVVEPRFVELLEEVVILLVPCVSPDGTDRVARWLREARIPSRGIPFLYHRYVGHDLNRDWLRGTQAEVRALIQQIHNKFRPWVTIDVHQMGRYGPRLFLPPYADPVDPAVSPEIRALTEWLGNHVFEELLRREHPGVARRWFYDAWTPARAYPFYHGGLRVLIEVASGRYSQDINVSERDLWVFGTGNEASADYPRPWKGGVWGLVQATDLVETATQLSLLALLEEPLRSGEKLYRERIKSHREAYLLDGRHADPTAIVTLLRSLHLAGVQIRDGRRARTWRLRDPAWGRGWCRSLLLCNEYPSTLRRQGDVVEVELSRSERGTFNTVPYDASTHNLALLAGVDVTQVQQEDVEPTERGATTVDSVGLMQTLRGRKLRLPASAAMRQGRWLVTQRALNVLKSLADWSELGVRVERLSRPVEGRGRRFGPGDFLFPAINEEWIDALVQEGSDATELAAETFDSVRRDGDAIAFRYPDVYLFRTSEPSKDQGWLRWVLEDYGVRFRTLTTEELEAVALTVSEPSSTAPRRVLLIPEGGGRVDRSVGRHLSQLVGRGWRIVAFGRSAAWLALNRKLPVEPLVLDADAIPGTILQTAFPSEPETAGLGSILWGYAFPPAVLHDRGPLWRVRSEPSSVGVPTVLLTLDSETPRRCGLLYGVDEDDLRGRACVVRIAAPESTGEWILCGFRPYYRGWTLSSFRLLFNLIYAP